MQERMGRFIIEKEPDFATLSRSKKQWDRGRF